MPRDVFISHSHEDAAFAKRVCEHIESAGFLCWIAPRDTPAGHFAGAIAREIRMCRVMVVVISRHSIASAHVISEVAQAFKGLRTILPIRLDMTPLSDDLEHYLVNAHQIEPGSGGEAGMLDELSTKIRKHLSDEPEPTRTGPGHKTGPVADPVEVLPPVLPHLSRHDTQAPRTGPAPYQPQAQPQFPPQYQPTPAIAAPVVPPLLPGSAKTWPLVVGSISIFFGAVQGLCNIVTLAIMPALAKDPSLASEGGITVFHGVDSVLRLIAGGAFVLAGILALKRLPANRVSHIVAAWVMLGTLLYSCIFQALGDSIPAADAAESVGRAVGLIFGGLLFGAYPIFLLIWFWGGKHALPARTSEP